MKSKRPAVFVLAVVVCLLLAVSLSACQKLCTITFEEEGVVSQTVRKGQRATKPFLERENMRVEWYSDKELTQPFDFDAIVDSDVTLYPKWISTASETVNVTFKSEGRVVGALTAVRGEKFNPVFLAETNKTLDGWHIEGESEFFDFEAGAERDVTLVAVWGDTRGILNVTFKNGDEEMSVAVGAGEKIFAPEIQVEEGQALVGWFESEAVQSFDFENTTVDSDIVLYARFEKKSYTITFIDWDGDELQSLNILHGDNALSLAETPYHDYSSFYDFAGWDCSVDLTEVSCDAVAKATYDANYLPEEMLAFDLRYDGTYAVRLKDNAETDYSHYEIAEYSVLPETYNGKPVTMVESRGFMPKKAFVFDGEIHLLVPHTYEIVGGQAFESFKGVEIVLAEGVREIWNRAFGDQMYKNIKLVLPSSLTLIEYWSITFGHFEIELADGENYISDEKGIWTKDRKTLCYIHNRDMISEFIVPEGTEYIAPAVFAYTYLENVTVEGALEGIGGDNFIDDSLQSIIFLDTVERAESGEDTDYNLNYWIEDETERHDLFCSLWYSASFQKIYIENFALPNGLKHIGADCFKNIALTEINLDGVEYIGSGAFVYVMEGTPALQSVTVTNSPNYYSHQGVALVARGTGAQGGDRLMMYATQNKTMTEYATPTAVTTIDSFSMKAKYIEKLSVSEGCLEILGGGIEFIPAIAGQDGAAVIVELPSSLTTITAQLSKSYWGYDDVSYVTEPAINLWYGKIVYAKSFGVADMGSQTIAVLRSYTQDEFVIPASVTEFGDGYGISSLKVKTFLVEEGNATFVAFDGWLYKKLSATKLRLVAVPRLTEKIVEGELVFPETAGYTLIEIGDYVFYNFSADDFLGLHGISRIIVPEGIEKIGFCAFASCQNLLSVQLPSTLRKIETGAFSQCENLLTVVFQNDLAPELEGARYAKDGGIYRNSVFYVSYGYWDETNEQYIEFHGLPLDCKLYVPDQSFEAYKLALGLHALQEDGKDTYSASVCKVSEMSVE